MNRIVSTQMLNLNCKFKLLCCGRLTINASGADDERIDERMASVSFAQSHKKVFHNFTARCFAFSIGREKNRRSEFTFLACIQTNCAQKPRIKSVSLPGNRRRSTKPISLGNFANQMGSIRRLYHMRNDRFHDLATRLLRYLKRSRLC